jgi:hypothetical protein
VHGIPPHSQPAAGGRSRVRHAPGR